MEGSFGKNKGMGPLSRRQTLALAAAGSLVAFEKSHAELSSGIKATYLKDNRNQDPIPYPNTNGGVGSIDIKYFGFEGHTEPNIFLNYSIPPGASEGVHTHRLGDSKAGSFDEFYFIVSGRGVMEIDGEKIEVEPGDHIFTPNGVAHGIANTLPDTRLEVFLIAIKR